MVGARTMVVGEDEGIAVVGGAPTFKVVASGSRSPDREQAATVRANTRRAPEKTIRRPTLAWPVATCR